MRIVVVMIMAVLLTAVLAGCGEELPGYEVPLTIEVTQHNIDNLMVQYGWEHGWPFNVYGTLECRVYDLRSAKTRNEVMFALMFHDRPMAFLITEDGEEYAFGPHARTDDRINEQEWRRLGVRVDWFDTIFDIRYRPEIGKEFDPSYPPWAMAIVEGTVRGQCGCEGTGQEDCSLFPPFLTRP